MLNLFYRNRYMLFGFRRARRTMRKNYGGPFGACIVKNNKILAVASIMVLKKNDPTAHAEIEAIRSACRKLKTYDLSGCQLYATGYPCPMCLSAIIWANIKEVYYATDLKDAEEIGFRDDFIYKYLQDKDPEVLSLEQIGRDDCIKLFQEYKEQNKVIY